MTGTWDLWPPLSQNLTLLPCKHLAMLARTMTLQTAFDLKEKSIMIF
jgi:hypothetical protein